MVDLAKVNDVIGEMGGIVSIVHDRYTWRGLTVYPLGSQAGVAVVTDFIARGEVFAYVDILAERSHAVRITKAYPDADEYVLHCEVDAADQILVLRLRRPSDGDREVAKEWLAIRDLRSVGEDLQARHDWAQGKPARVRKGKPLKKYQAVMVHAARDSEGTLVTMAAIGFNQNEIAAMAYPGMDTVGQSWNQRIQTALDNGGKPLEFVEHWLERVNGNTEDLSKPFEIEAEDAQDAAHAALVKHNDTIGMVVKV